MRKSGDYGPKTPVHDIVQIAAEIFKVTPTGIIGRSRKQHLIRARQAVCKVAYDQGWSSPIIGRRLSGRDHTTILHARDQVDIHKDYDVLFASRFARLREEAKPKPHRPQFMPEKTEITMEECA